MFKMNHFVVVPNLEIVFFFSLDCLPLPAVLI